MPPSRWLLRWLLTTLLACVPVAVFAADAPDGPTDDQGAVVWSKS